MQKPDDMTLRDWFAGRTLPNAFALATDVTDEEMAAWFGKDTAGITRAQIVAAFAYSLADEMLARRAELSQWDAGANAS